MKEIKPEGGYAPTVAFEEVDDMPVVRWDFSLFVAAVGHALIVADCEIGTRFLQIKKMPQGAARDKATIDFPGYKRSVLQKHGVPESVGVRYILWLATDTGEDALEEVWS